VFFTLLLVFSLSIFGESSNLAFLCMKRLEEIIKDVSLLTLGSLGNISLVQEVGKHVGSVVKSLGYDYYLIGPLDTLSIDDDDYFYRVHKSPYITADVYEKLALGIAVAGVIPVFDGRGQIDTNLVTSIITRRLTYPVLVEDEGKVNLLRTLGYDGVFIIQQRANTHSFLNGSFVRLYWNTPLQEVGELRKKLLLNSITYVSNGEIKVKVPFASSGVVVYSNEDYVLKEAKNVLENRIGPGRIPW